MTARDTINISREGRGEKQPGIEVNKSNVKSSVKCNYASKTQMTLVLPCQISLSSKNELRESGFNRGRSPGFNF